MIHFVSLPIVPILTTALLATAFTNVWNTFFLKETSKAEEGAVTGAHLRVVVGNVCVYGALFFVLAQLLSFVHAEYITLATLGMYASVPAALLYALDAFKNKHTFRLFVVHALRTIFVVTGGLSVIAYWPW